MTDPFKTGRIKTAVLPGIPDTLTDVSPPSAPSSSSVSVPSVVPSAPSSSNAPRSSGIPLAPPSSDSGWRTDVMSSERATDPGMAFPVLRLGASDRATLTLLSGVNAGQAFALDGTEHVLGRGTDADVWVEDSGVSRRHARVRCYADGRYVIEDLGSTNGTFVGSERVTRAEVRPGDRIQLGPHVVFRFQIVDDAEEELQRRLYESSTRDALTRIYNRKYFSERLAAEVAYARRHRIKLAVLLLDLDDFKSMNDTHGHLAGDMILRLVANQMQKLIRLEDLLARYGGEEFVILARSTGKTDATRLAERIRKAVAASPIALSEALSLRCTLSVGVASLQDLPAEGGPTELLALADARLYRAKAGGKNRVCADG